jgi:DNA methylase
MVTAPIRRLNAICPYFTMFPLEFPLRVLAEARADHWVLDPFCGRGTTVFAARLRGLGTVGIDVNPVATALAAAKLVHVGAETVIRRCRALLRNDFEPADIPQGEFWETCFHPSTLADVCRLREQLLGAPAEASIVALRALVLGILHGPLRKSLPTYLSNQMPRTYATKPAAAVRFWRARDLRPPKVDVLDAVKRRTRFSLAELPPRVPGMVRRGDATVEVARLLPSFSWIITSPPYYGMRTYLPDQWLRAWFLGGPPRVEYSVDGQVAQQSEANFVASLAAIWRAAAKRSVPGARLIVRFGALPSAAKDPGDLLTRSIVDANAGWTITTMTPSGAPGRRGARQAEQFANAGVYVEEIDCHAILTG